MTLSYKQEPPQPVRSAGEGTQGFDVLGKHSADWATSPAQICIYILLIQVLMWSFNTYLLLYNDFWIVHVHEFHLYCFPWELTRLQMWDLLGWFLSTFSRLLQQALLAAVCCLSGCDTPEHFLWAPRTGAHSTLRPLLEAVTVSFLTVAHDSPHEIGFFWFCFSSFFFFCSRTEVGGGKRCCPKVICLSSFCPLTLSLVTGRKGRMPSKLTVQPMLDC